MSLKPHKIILDIRVFHHIKTGKGYQRLHTKKLKVQMHWLKQIVQSLTVKKPLIGIIKGCFGGI